MGLSLEEKYKLYEGTVQNHGSDIDFINKEYKRFYKRKALTFREDFGGTGAMACDWTKLSKKHQAYAIDLDPEPIIYGQKHHYSKLNESEKDRMFYIENDVLKKQKFKADIIAAFNFSYFIFKERKVLLEYFKKVRQGLNEKGAFFIDLFGGTEAFQELEEETEFDDYSYYWDCDKYNPLTSECLYHIHFKTKKDNKKYRNVFTYDWRMWHPRELKEIMEDAGFSKVYTYWEGDDEDSDGEGNGDFSISNEEENCESWVIYMCALP